MKESRERNDNLDRTDIIFCFFLFLFKGQSKKNGRSLNLVQEMNTLSDCEERDHLIIGVNRFEPRKHQAKPTNAFLYPIIAATITLTTLILTVFLAIVRMHNNNDDIANVMAFPPLLTLPFSQPYIFQVSCNLRPT